MHVASLHVYPIKGGRGIALERAEVIISGIRHDRRFMLVDTDGKHITQRDHPRLALVETRIEGDRLSLSIARNAEGSSRPAEGSSRPAPRADARLSVPLAPEGPQRRVRIWDDEVDTIEAPGEAAAFFSEHLGQSCSLVFMPPDAIRLVEAPYGKPSDRVGFADRYPILVASLASLADLNERLEEVGAARIPMNRFRPNVVVEGGEPFAEDRAARMHIGDRNGPPLAVRTPKKCARCKVTTIDQATAATGTEPLRTLAAYRSEGKHVLFAMNAIPELDPGQSAWIAVGNDVAYEWTS